MKNILVISQNFWPEKFLVNEFCDELKKKNYRITILTGKSGYYLSNSELKKKRKSCKKYKYHQAFTLDRGNSYIRLIFNYLSFVISGIILIFFNSYKKKFDYVIVYATSPMTQVIVGYFAKIIFNVKFIIWVQDLWPNILESFFYKKTKSDF